MMTGRKTKATLEEHGFLRASVLLHAGKHRFRHEPSGEATGKTYKGRPPRVETSRPLRYPCGTLDQGLIPPRDNF